MESKFKIGDRVGLSVRLVTDYWSKRKSVEPLRYTDGGDLSVGEIADITQKGLVMVHWDSSWANEKNEPVDPNHLMLESELNKIYSKIEEEYLETEKQIKTKLREAAVAIGEAGKMSEKVHMSLAEMHEAVSPLMSALDDAGWRTSSLGC